MSRIRRARSIEERAATPSWTEDVRRRGSSAGRGANVIEGVGGVEFEVVGRAVEDEETEGGEDALRAMGGGRMRRIPFLMTGGCSVVVSSVSDVRGDELVEGMMLVVVVDEEEEGSDVGSDCCAFWSAWRQSDEF